MTVVNSGREGRRLRRRFAPWGVLVGFALLAVGLSWPLAAHLSTRVPGTATWAFDESTFLWNIWYFKHALLDLHISPLHTSLIWYPLGIDLILYTFNFFNALIALPLQLAANVPFASNITLLAATALSGFGAYLLAMWVLGPGTGANRGRLSPTAARLAALLAGIIYAFGSNRAVYAALGHYNFFTTEWIPFYTLYLLRTLRPLQHAAATPPGVGDALPRRRWLKDAALAGLFFALAALADMTYASLLGLLSVVMVLVSWRSLGCTLRARLAALARPALIALAAAVIWSPVLVPVAREFLTGGYAISGWGETVKLSADAAGLVTPTELNPLLGGHGGPVGPAANAAPAAPVAAGSTSRWQVALRAVEEGKARFSDINTVFLGWLTLALAALGVWVAARQARRWTYPWARTLASVWGWTALVFGVLALGPLLQINGRYLFSLDNLLPGGVSFPLPFTLLHFIPFLNANRAPNRNSLILMLALAVLAAYAAAWLLGKLDQHNTTGTARRRPTLAYGVAGVLAVGLIIEHLALPLPTTDATIPAIYQQIAAEPGDFAIMQVPIGWRNSFGILGSERTQLQYYQSAHGKPIIGGNISRAPDFEMAYFRHIPLFRALTDLELYQDVPQEVDQAARAQAGALMALYDVRYLITYPPVPGGYPYYDTWQRTQDYALSVIPVEQPAFWEANGVKAYRVRQPSIPFPFRLDLGTANLEPYLGQGWSNLPAEQPYGATAAWVTQTAAALFLPLDAAKDVTLRLSVAPLAYPGAADQTLSISVNGAPIWGPAPLAAGWQTISAHVPAAATRRGPNAVRLTFGHTASPRRVFPDPASRGVIGSTGVVSPVNLDVHGFSEAYISAFGPDGAEVKASVGRRGYNVAVIDAKTGQVLDQQGFDTAANTYESDRLAAYLAGVGRGQIVALATKGDAAAHLTPAAVKALAGLGSRVTATGELVGQSHALVGVQGAAPGSAAEAIGPDAFVRVSGDFRSLAAAVDWVELGP
jgi:hypothetical protein